MVTDNQVRRLFRLLNTETTLSLAAMKAGMDVKTARRYKQKRKLPSELKIQHNWRNRPDPFAEVWQKVITMLSINSGLHAKTIFEYLQRREPGKYTDGQLRTLQRRIKVWRATEGPPRKVYFPQKHYPGNLAESDFTSMNNLHITIAGRHFKHLFYHFVLTYSNWETGTICFSESFESLSEGLQNAIWMLGGVPKNHLTDRLTAAVRKAGNPEMFTDRYAALLRHYKVKGRRTNPSSPNENGDVEQSNNRFKIAVDQSLMIRGSRDFAYRKEYSNFLMDVLDQLNSGRRERFEEELKVLGRLPMKRLESCKRLPSVKVRRSSTIHIAHNTYSVNSRLIGEHVNIRLYAEYLEVWYGQKKVDHMPRLRGESNHSINYRHVIDWLVRKPGAFENYKWREDLFPTIRFRMAYDILKEEHVLSVAAKEYLKILEFAAKGDESAVDKALRILIDSGESIGSTAVDDIIKAGVVIPAVTNVTIPNVKLTVYDSLLSFDMAVVQ